MAKKEPGIKELALTIDKLEDEKLLFQNQLKKALADYTNLERDLDKRIESRGIQMKIQIARTLMNVLDDISLAMEAGKKLSLGEDVKAWMEGVNATLSHIEKAISEFGIVRMEVKKGDSFDPSLHEALGTVNEGEKGKIHEVIQPGYLLGEVVVRPARVIVAQGS
jgi:molecular chaperone GrpE